MIASATLNEQITFQRQQRRPNVTEVYGVFEGGGVRGSALVGAVAAAEQHGITFRACAGTSAGAIVASLLAAGYSAQELKDVLQKTDFRNFMDQVYRWPRFRLPGLGVPAWQVRAAIWKMGLYKGEAFHEWITQLISQRVAGRQNAAVFFKDLPKPLTVIAADVVRQQIKVFSATRSPDIAVADAVRMSMSIPFFFCPIQLGRELVVDGGILSNFPAWAFDTEQRKTKLPILGFRLQDADAPLPHVRNALDMIYALVNTTITATIPLQISHLKNLHIIELPTLGIRTTQFNLSDEDKQKLYDEGLRTANIELSKMVWAQPPRHSRGATVELPPITDDPFKTMIGEPAHTGGLAFPTMAPTGELAMPQMAVPQMAAPPSSPAPAMSAPSVRPPAAFAHDEPIGALFDRTAERALLRDYLSKKLCCQIIGPAGIGKTALVKALPALAQQWQMRLAIALIELRDPACQTLAGWLRALSGQWKLPQPLQATSQLSYAAQWLQQQGAQPVLCLDGFEAIAVRPDEFTSDFLLDLRGLADLGVSIIVTARQPLSELVPQHLPVSPFFNLFNRLTLGPFSPDDAADFVTLYPTGGAPFTTAERNAILQVTRAPGALRQACDAVIQARRTGESIERALRDIERGQ